MRMAHAWPWLWYSASLEIQKFFLTSTNDQEVLCAYCVCFWPCGSVCVLFLKLEVVALANVPLHLRTCLQSSHLWKARRPTEHSPSVTLIRRFVRNEQERDPIPPVFIQFCWFLPCSILARKSTMTREWILPFKKKQRERVNLPFFPYSDFDHSVASVPSVIPSQCSKLN